MSIKPSVIISTYNKPRELELVLCGLSNQVVAPFEILIADDGSSQSTADLISNWKKKCPTPIIHVWHKDTGFHKSKICNQAARQARGDYLIFLDGDSIPHPKWTNDHISAAKEGTVLCGRRVRLGPDISSTIDLQFVQSGKLKITEKSLLASILQRETKRYLLGIRLPSFICTLSTSNGTSIDGSKF